MYSPGCSTSGGQPGAAFPPRTIVPPGPMSLYRLNTSSIRSPPDRSRPIVDIGLAEQDRLHGSLDGIHLQGAHLRNLLVRILVRIGEFHLLW